MSASPPPFLSGLDRAVRLVGDRWSLLILAALQDGPQRYGDLQRQVDGISSNVLAQRLSALESAGLVVAEPYSRRPPRMRYAVTAAGRELAAPLAALAAWGGRHAPTTGEPALRHELCGTPLDLRWHCPACEIDVPVASGGEAWSDPAIFLA